MNNVKSFVEKLIKGTKVGGDRNPAIEKFIDRIDNYLYDGDSTLVVDEKKGENEKMSIPEIIWKRHKSIFQSLDLEDVKTMEKNFLSSFKIPNGWKLWKRKDERGKEFFRFLNFDPKKNDWEDMELVKTVKASIDKVSWDNYLNAINIG